MNKTTRPEASPTLSKWLRFGAIVGIVWYCFGLMQFWLAYTLDPTAAIAAGDISAEYGKAITSTPLLIWLAFAFASLAGLFGSILLFRQSKNTKVVFGLSLLSAILYYGWIFGLSGTGGDRPQEDVIIAVVVVCVTTLFFFISLRKT